MSIDILTVCYTVYAPNVYISHLDWNKEPVVSPTRDAIESRNIWRITMNEATRACKFIVIQWILTLFKDTNVFINVSEVVCLPQLREAIEDVSLLQVR